jgi:hypothetical protein
MSYYDIPFEIVLILAQKSQWYIFIQVDRRVAEYTRNNRKTVEDLITRMVIQPRRTVYILPNGVLHRNDGPATIYSDIHQWYQYGRIHRDNDKPAVVVHGLYSIWYKNGVTHRENDKPAVIHYLVKVASTIDKIIINPLKIWYKNGLKHRDNNLPAVVYSSGKYEYWTNGDLIK